MLYDTSVMEGRHILALFIVCLGAYYLSISRELMVSVMSVCFLLLNTEHLAANSIISSAPDGPNLMYKSPCASPSGCVCDGHPLDLRRATTMLTLYSDGM